MRNYKKIKAFQSAHELVIEMYSLTNVFPNEEKFGLISQIRRASVSIAANIVEGARRNSKKEYLQFLYISQGSLSEVEYYLHLSKELGFIGGEKYAKIETRCNQVFSMLFGLIEAVKNEVLASKDSNLSRVGG